MSNLKRAAIRSLVLLLTLCLLAGCAAPPPGAAAPLIGITSVFQSSGKTHAMSVNMRYVRAVQEGGGVPVVLPPIPDARTIEEYLRVLDGLVLVGGKDIPPEDYGQEPHKTVRPMPKPRRDFERQLVTKWLDTGKPVLGVCLGAQTLNVARGGTLVQDIPSKVGRDVNHRREHIVEIVPGSRLARILGASKLTVVSRHHQSAERLGKGLRVAARSADGVVEAIENTGGTFLVGVQWHPEQMDKKHYRALFGALVRACNTASP